MRVTPKTMAQWHHELALAALARGMVMRSEIPPAESRRAGQWEREDVDRAEMLAARDREEAIRMPWPRDYGRLRPADAFRQRR